MCDDINADATAVADAVDAADVAGAVPGAMTLSDHPLMRNASVFTSHELLAMPDGPDSSRDMSDTAGIHNVSPRTDCRRRPVILCRRPIIACRRPTVCRRCADECWCDDMAPAADW